MPNNKTETDCIPLAHGIRLMNATPCGSQLGALFYISPQDYIAQVSRELCQAFGN